MALVSLPTIKYSSRFISHSPHSLPYISLPSKLQNLPLREPQKKAYVPSNSHSPISHQALIYSSFSSRHTRLALVPINAKNSGSGEEDHSDAKRSGSGEEDHSDGKHSGSGEEDHLDARHSGSREEDHRALETVNKFYAAIKNKNINQLSDIIGDECRCICNFSSFFQSYDGKMQVLDFLSNLIKSFGNNFEFIVKPTLHDGMHVGVSWRIECKNIRVPLGKGFSFHIMQYYQGKLYLRNVEMFMEPLLHIEPVRLKLIAFVMKLIDKMDIHIGSKSKGKRVVYFLLAMFLIFAWVYLFKLILN
ncbi:uncharacterized protein LOC115988343 [Quercus lobata]|uniref:uncharacterized protein LOC115988343 n=1 Tax=Quercus lobata TaxID=97700 RepID=UPI0012445EC8|nr:uncharacterized protein LOC115988343 [Quercus lobata]